MAEAGSTRVAAAIPGSRVRAGTQHRVLASRRERAGLREVVAAAAVAAEMEESVAKGSRASATTGSRNTAAAEGVGQGPGAGAKEMGEVAAVWWLRRQRQQRRQGGSRFAWRQGSR